MSKKRVYGVYDLCICQTNIYTPLNTLIHNALSCIFYPRVYVWRLILKKNHTCNLDITNQGYKIYGSFMPSLCLRYPFASSPLYLRYKTVPNPFLRIGDKWDLHRIYKGFARELQVCIFTLEKNIFAINLHTYIGICFKLLMHKNLQRFQIPHKPTLILH